MKDHYNSNEADILIGVSPLMCSKCYEVTQEFTDHFKDYPEAFIYENDKIYFDSKHVLLKKFVALGIKEQNIEFSDECTYCSKDKYFSYRRDQYGCHPENINAMMAVFGLKHN